MAINHLGRFLEAQETSYAAAFDEISAGRKKTHWMWYIFPQIRGLGSSATSTFYAVQDMQEAAAYLQHPLLGSRLIQISQALLRLSGNDALVIFGSPDNMKLRSSMTLFAALANAHPVFQGVLNKFFQSQPDPETLRILKQLTTRN